MYQKTKIFNMNYYPHENKASKIMLFIFKENNMDVVVVVFSLQFSLAWMKQSEDNIYLSNEKKREYFKIVILFEAKCQRKKYNLQSVLSKNNRQCGTNIFITAQYIKFIRIPLRFSNLKKGIFAAIITKIELNGNNCFKWNFVCQFRAKCKYVLDLTSEIFQQKANFWNVMSFFIHILTWSCKSKLNMIMKLMSRNKNYEMK